MNRIMLDLETMGNGPTAVITAIGAIRFDPDNGVLGDEFYMPVNMQSCLDAGLAVTGSTIQWWMQQSTEARRLYDRPGMPLVVALREFRSYVGRDKTDEIWGNGASFDNVILRSAYHAMKQEAPWDFWEDRCFRTARAMLPAVRLDREGTHHNALDDAKYQARYLMAAMEAGRKT